MKLFKVIICLGIFLQFQCNKSFKSETKNETHLNRTSLDLTYIKNNTNSFELREVIQEKQYKMNISAIE